MTHISNLLQHVNCQKINTSENKKSLPLKDKKISKVFSLQHFTIYHILNIIYVMKSNLAFILVVHPCNWQVNQAFIICVQYKYTF